MTKRFRCSYLRRAAAFVAVVAFVCCLHAPTAQAGCRSQSVVLHQQPVVLESACPEEVAWGPQQSEGAVIWLHGRSYVPPVNGEHCEGELALTDPYVISLYHARWDVFRLDRRFASDDNQTSAGALVYYVGWLKQQGYKRVIVAGQSAGALIALMAAARSADVYAVIATAPAGANPADPMGGAYSAPRCADVQSNDPTQSTWLRQANATILYGLLKRIKSARVMLFFFAVDPFDPGGRGPASEAILARRGVPHIVIDSPPGFSGHVAAATERFDSEFGRCIVAFVGAPAIPPGTNCGNIAAVR